MDLGPSIPEYTHCNLPLTAVNTPALTCVVLADAPCAVGGRELLDTVSQGDDRARRVVEFVRQNVVPCYDRKWEEWEEGSERGSRVRGGGRR